MNYPYFRSVVPKFPDLRGLNLEGINLAQQSSMILN